MAWRQRWHPRVYEDGFLWNLAKEEDERYLATHTNFSKKKIRSYRSKLTPWKVYADVQLKKKKISPFKPARAGLMLRQFETDARSTLAQAMASRRLTAKEKRALDRRFRVGAAPPVAPSVVPGVAYLYHPVGARARVVRREHARAPPPRLIPLVLPPPVAVVDRKRDADAVRGLKPQLANIPWRDRDYLNAFANSVGRVPWDSALKAAVLLNTYKKQLGQLFYAAHPPMYYYGVHGGEADARLFYTVFNHYRVLAGQKAPARSITENQAMENADKLRADLRARIQ